MLNRIQTLTSVITIVFITLIYIYYQTFLNNKNLLYSHHSNDLFEYSKELNELRYDINIIKKNIYHIEQTLSSTILSNVIISSIQTIFSYLTFFSSSFIMYTFFLYLFHLCVFHRSTTQTIKLLHIVNIISYLLTTILYTSFKHFHYSNLAWLLFVLLFVRLCIH